MTFADFVHLHNHSDYSLLDGASPIPRMVERAAEMGMPALALTDHGSLFGAVQFYQAARKAGVKPIVGMEAYVTRGGRRERTRDTAHHLVLLARDERGFRNLIRLSSIAFLEGFYYKPRVDHEVLARHAEGLLALSACPKGEVASDLLADDEAGALRTAHLYRDMFGAENYFLEIQNHGLEIEDRIRPRVAALARRTGIPLVGTNDCHYLRHEDADAHDVLLCIQTGAGIDDPKRMRMGTDQLYFKSPDEMKARFGEYPEALANTLAIAERCNLQLDFGRPLLPEFPLPPGVESAERHLRDLVAGAVGERFGEITEAIRQRLGYELDVICRMGFASYFLIVRDFIAYARSRGIGVGPGRGSVAGSLVAYVLRITDIDPLAHGLIFERFLNPERVTMPDIDIDFDDLRRSEVIEYVKLKYGEDCVTQIITFGTMGAKGVLRDVGRALGMPYAECDRIARLVPPGLGVTLERAIDEVPDLRALPQKGVQHDRLLRSARVLEGLARHASTHAAGVLITPGPLLDYVPLYRQKDESVTTQWDMKSVEKAGLLKMDFLGLRTLSVLAEAVELIERGRGERVGLSALPMDDAEAYRVFQEAETVGIFQFESSGMRDQLRRLRPSVFEDLVAMNALYRPGPMENIPYFIDCKHGRKVARFDHPALEPILRGTYGVFVYQEQVMAAANALAGFSMAQADELRRAMGKKKPEQMEAKRKAFVDGCVKNRMAPAKAEKIFATMEKFAGYGFNKCCPSNTLLVDAETGREVTIGDLFRTREPFVVHALGEDWKLRARRVTDVVWNGRRRVFRLRTRQGKSIRATDNHPFRTLEGWKTLGELCPGDRIAAPRHLRVPAKRTWPRHEIVALAGLLAEGNTCHPTTLYYHSNTPELIEDFRAAIACFPDTVTRVYQRRDGRLEVHANLGRSGWIREDVGFAYGDGMGQTEGNLALVLDAARRSGAFLWARALDLVGRRASEKRIPDAMLELRDADLELFLGRLWAGDGFLADLVNWAPYYATSSEALAYGVQRVLLRLGMQSGVHVKRFGYRGSLRVGYAVYLLGIGTIRTFLEAVAPHIPGRDAQLGLLRRHMLEKSPSNSCRDTVPIGILRQLDAERRDAGLTWDDLSRQAGVRVSGPRPPAAERRKGLRRDTVARVARVLGSPGLAAIAESDVYWDTISSIEPEGVEDVYDLTVEGEHNFVADGLVVHNSHSAAYALVAYQCAWLKAHYPAEFMAATLTSEMSDSARIVTLIAECRRMGLALQPPDVNRSEWKFTLEDGGIRFGLGAVRNVGQASIEALVAARREGEPFHDLFDLARRLDARALNRRVLESLIAAGACDSLGAERGAMFAGAGRALEHAASLQRERQSGQSSLFGESESAIAVASLPLPPAEPWSSRERSTREKEVLGFYFSEHPLERLRGTLERVATHAIADALQLEDGAEVRLAGLVGEIKAITTRAGKPMAILTLEDLSGRVECTLFPEVYESARGVLGAEEEVVVAGRIEVREDRGTKLLAAEVKRLEDARTAYRLSLHLEARAHELSQERLARVDELLSAHPGEADVYLHIVRPDHSRLAMRSRRFRVAEGESVVEALRGSFPWLRARWGKGAS